MYNRGLVSPHRIPFLRIVFPIRGLDRKGVLGVCEQLVKRWISILDLGGGVESPFLGDVLMPSGEILSAENGSKAPVNVSGDLAGVVAGSVVVRKPRTVRVFPGDSSKMPTPRLVYSLGNGSVRFFSKNIRIGVGISRRRDQVQDLLVGRVKHTSSCASGMRFLGIEP